MDFIPPKGSSSHLNLIINKLLEINPGGGTSIYSMLKNAANLIKKRSLIILISDLYEQGNDENVLKYIKYLNSKKNELIVFHLMDNKELEFDFNETLVFEGLEDKERLLVYPALVREEYKKIINEFIKKYKDTCEKNNIDYHLFNTSTPVEQALSVYLKKRERMQK